VDLILSDILMPDMDGYEFFQALRKDPVTAQIPIVATSASVYPQDQARSLDAGADLFLPKPIELEQLLHALNGLLDLTWQPEAARQRQEDAHHPHAGSVDGVPPPQTIAQLLDFARAGDVIALQQAGSELEAEMPDSTFVARLLPLVRTFQMEQLVAWLETYSSNRQDTKA
jgi:response regulator RpfG family c-di-GMP phosphodiesterase